MKRILLALAAVAALSMLGLPLVEAASTAKRHHRSTRQHARPAQKKGTHRKPVRHHSRSHRTVTRAPKAARPVAPVAPAPVQAPAVR